MSCQFTATIAHLEDAASLPAGSQALTSCPAGVAKELEAIDVTDAEFVDATPVILALNSAGFSIGQIFQLLPLILQILQNEQLRDLFAQLLAALKPKSVEALTEALDAASHK